MWVTQVGLLWPDNPAFLEKKSRFLSEVFSLEMLHRASSTLCKAESTQIWAPALHSQGLGFRGQTREGWRWGADVAQGMVLRLIAWKHLECAAE